MTETRAPDVSPDAAIQIRRVRLILGACAALWGVCLWQIVVWDFGASGITIDEHRRLMFSTISAMGLSLAGATFLRPGARSSWAVAVISASVQLMTCLLTPVGAYLLYLLFRPQVMRACISRAFGHPTDIS